MPSPEPQLYSICRVRIRLGEVDYLRPCIGAPLFDARMEEVEKVLGYLTGELARSFEKWMG